MDSENGYQIIKARTPLAELYKYSTTLKSLTQGKASFMNTFAEYVPVPPDIQIRLAEEHKKEAAEA
jgi:elongation factor G